MASKQAKIEFLSHISTIYSTPRCRAQWQTCPEAPTSHFLNRRVGIHALSGFEFAVVGQLCTQNWCHACMPVYKCTFPCTTHSKPQASGKPNRCGSVLLDRKDPTFFQFYKNNNSKYLNFQFNAMQFLDIWKCIKRYQNATLSITPRKSKTFCCCNGHYFSSHDQHVWSSTQCHLSRS